MPKASEPRSTILAAQESFICAIGGETFNVRKGDLIDADHPVVAKYPTLFGPPTLRFPRVEAATAAPGEKRGE